MAVNSTILGQNYIGLPSGTTAERPGSAQFGWFRANTSTGYLEYYDSVQSSWIGVGAFIADGGSTGTYTVSSTTYTYHVFTSTGTFSVKSGSKSCDLLIVGGGGGGGAYGGGGGGGAVIYVASRPLTVGEYPVTIGPGGTGNGIGNAASTRLGGTTSAIGYSATGGGGAGCYNNIPAGNGGNGGGAGAYGSSNGSGPGTGVAPSGDGYTTIYAGRTGGDAFGGNVLDPSYPLGAGAGSNQNGGAPASNSSNGGNGGNGISINMTGTAYSWAGGGGGGVYQTSNYSTVGGEGGLGGGGDGGGTQAAGGSGWNTGGTSSFTIGGNGGANTGGGGGGSCYNEGGASGGTGGSGIVIIRYISSTA
jgi:fibronectin-binding autotransporter adhesin